MLKERDREKSAEIRRNPASTEQGDTAPSLHVLPGRRDADCTHPRRFRKRRRPRREGQEILFSQKRRSMPALHRQEIVKNLPGKDAGQE